MAQQNPTTGIGDLDGVVDAAIQIADIRRDILSRMRLALEAGDDEEALKFAAQLCGVSRHEETGD